MKAISCVLIFVLLSLSQTAYTKNAKDIYRQVNQSVISIYAMDFDERRIVMSGSAVAISKYTLATNCHIALAGNYVVVKIKKEVKLAPLFYHNKKKDLCFIQVPGVTFKPVTLRASRDVEIGEDVYAVGNPRGFERSFSRGIISNKRETQGAYILQSDAQISKGSSGGGLFDRDGNLIGITFATHKKARNITFALPTEWIYEIVKSAKTTGKMPKVKAKPSSEDIRGSHHE